MKKEGDGTAYPGDPEEPFRAGVHLKDHLRVLLVRRWVLAAVFFTVTAGTALYVFTRTPTYRAKAVLLIEPARPNLTRFAPVYDPAMNDGDFNRRTFLETQYALILCPPLVEATFHRFHFERKPPFRDAEDPLSEFRKCFAVTPVRRTRLAEVSFEWTDPELAAKVVEFHVNAYLEEYRRRTLGVSREGLEALRKRAEELQPEVEKKARALQQFMAENNMVSLEKSQDIIVERLQSLNRTLTEVERQRIHAQSRYENIARAVRENRPLEEMPEVIGSDTIRDLKLEYIRAKQELIGLSDRFGPRHPEVQAAQARLDSVAEKMRNEIRQVLAAAEAEYTRARDQEAELRTALADQQGKVLDFNEKSVKYNLLKEAYDAANKTYSSVKKLIEEMEITIATGNKADNIFIVAHPRVPVRPARPRKLLALVLAAATGLLLGAGLCFFVEYLDTSIKGKDEAEQLLAVPVMGYVPPLAVRGRKKHEPGGDALPPELVTLAEPHTPAAEAFRSLRTALTFSHAGEGLKSLLVTSAGPMEGKTLVSLNLAAALAKAERRVLLVDGDMRKPRLSRALSESGGIGLSDLLARGAIPRLEAAIRATEVEGLHVLPSGPVPPNPSELLGGEGLVRLLAEAATRYDHVIFDTPPVIHATDAAVLARRVEGALLVVRAFSTSREVALRARDVLRRAQGRVVGVVLNGVDAPRGGYDGYGYYEYRYPGYYGEMKREGTHAGRGSAA